MIQLRILTLVCLISLFGQFMRRMGFGASSRNHFVLMLRELNEDILCHSGRMAFLAFWIYLLCLLYAFFLKDPVP